MERELREVKQLYTELTKRVDNEIARNKVHDLVMENTMKVFSKQFIVIAASQIVLYTTPPSRKNKARVELCIRYKTLADFECNVVKPARLLVLLHPHLRTQCPEEVKIIDEYVTRS